MVARGYLQLLDLMRILLASGVHVVELVLGVPDPLQRLPAPHSRSYFSVPNNHSLEGANMYSSS